MELPNSGHCTVTAVTVDSRWFDSRIGLTVGSRQSVVGSLLLTGNRGRSVVDSRLWAGGGGQLVVKQLLVGSGQ